MKKQLQHPSAQGLFNAGTGDPVSLQKLVDTMATVFGEGEKIEFEYKPEQNSQPNFTFDMSKIMQTFDYKPQYDIESIMEDIKRYAPDEAFKVI